MSDQADTTQTDVATPQQDTQADPNAALMARFDELTAGLQELRQPQQPQDQRGLAEYAQEPWQQAEQEPETDSYQAQPQDDQEAERVAYEQLQQLISTQVQQGIQQSVQPFIVQQQAEQLEAKYPDLKDPAVVGPLFEEAKRFAQQIGSPDLAYKPQFIEKFYLAQRASSQAAQETPADGGTGVHLETGAGQAQGQEVDERDRIVGQVQPQGFGWY